MFNCPNCGRQLPDDSVFCEGCGTPVSRYGAVQQSKQAPKKSGKSLIMLLAGIIIGIMLITMMGWALAGLVNSGGNTNSPSAESVKATEASTSESAQSASATSESAQSESKSEASSDSANETSSTSADTGSSTSSSTDSATQATGKEIAVIAYDKLTNTNNPAYQNAILVLFPDTSQWFYYTGILQEGDPTRETVEAIVNNNAYADTGTFSRKDKNSNVYIFDSKDQKDFCVLHEVGAKGERLVVCNEKGEYESGANCVYFAEWYDGVMTLK